ncbi:MAG: hypothetical protein R3F14_38020 [Polyangiaceae bacterium]
MLAAAAAAYLLIARPGDLPLYTMTVEGGVKEHRSTPATPATPSVSPPTARS